LPLTEERERFPDENGNMWRSKAKEEVEGLGREKLRNLA
jgi:hypothetical protein